MTKKPQWSSHFASRQATPGADAGPTRDELAALLARFNAGGFAEAEAGARTLTRRFPRHPFGWKVLGAALKQQGRLADALPAMRQAAELARNDAEAHSNLGIVLLNLGLLAEAEACLRRALELKPGYAAVHSNLGAVVLGLGRPEEAETHYRKTLELAPDYAEAHNNLGISLLDQARLSDAEASMRRALALAPDYDAALTNLGNIRQDQSRTSEAAIAHRRAAALFPGSLPHAVRARLLLPIVQESRDATIVWRKRYRDGIAALQALPAAPLKAAETLNTSSYYLACHDENDRPLIEDMGRLFRQKCPNLTALAPHVAGWRGVTAGRRLRVGFLSKFFFLHTISKLFRGYIRHLDRDRFEVVVIHTNRSKDDEFKQDLNTHADKVVVLPPDLDDQQKAIAAEELDVLFYPDIGAPTYFPAFARLAPVQAVGWGHPDTSGLHTVDYYVSAAPMEPEDADDHYTERLICLNRMPSFYWPPEVPDPLPTRAALGLPETGTLYGCVQNLFEFHPDFDAVLTEIAEGDPSGRFVLAEGNDPTWSRLLRQRWQRTAPILLDRVIFLPPPSPSDFIALMAHLDVGLDPPHFSGGNTFYEAMATGLPVVTWPGRFMRGRMTAGAYRQMGIADPPVVSALADYAPLALALGRDPERREALRRTSAIAAARELYEDRMAVSEFETFLEAAAGAAARGEKLPKGWRPERV